MRVQDASPRNDKKGGKVSDHREGKIMRCYVKAKEETCAHMHAIGLGHCGVTGSTKLRADRSVTSAQPSCIFNNSGWRFAHLLIETQMVVDNKKNLCAS